MKRLTILLLFTLLPSYLGVEARGDTGTYDILEYRITLAPRTDGQVEITYFQQWRVKSGHIPWITVGTANGQYRILGNPSRNGRTVRSANQGSWSGVRIDLDGDYQPGETFEVEFAVLQGGLFYRHAKGYRLDFIPGWYDRAPIERLQVELVFFADLEGFMPEPEPKIAEARRMVWETALKPGGRFSIQGVFPKGLFPQAIKTSSSSSSSSKGGRVSRSGKKPFFLVFGGMIFIFVIVFAVIMGRVKGNRYGRGGRIGMGGRHFHGTGCVVSCACACVACACACACAGGGGAGCDRKLTRTCPLCADCGRLDCPLRREPALPAPSRTAGETLHAPQS